MDIVTYYKQGHTGYQASTRADTDSRLANICDLTRRETQPQGKILDLGCGDMYLSKLMPEFHWTGLDIDETQDKRIIKHDLAQAPYPFPTGAFDTVICSEVLEHLFDPVAVIKEARRVTRPMGTLVLTVPNAHTFENLLGAFQGLIFDPTNLFSVEHIRLYTVPSMTELLQRHRWDVIHFTGNSPHMSPRFHQARYWMRQYFPKESDTKIDQMLGNMFPCNCPGMTLLAKAV